MAVPLVPMPDGIDYAKFLESLQNPTQAAAVSLDPDAAMAEKLAEQKAAKLGLIAPPPEADGPARLGTRVSESITNKGPTPEGEDLYKDLLGRYQGMAEQAGERDLEDLQGLKERLETFQGRDKAADVRPLAAMLDTWGRQAGIGGNTSAFADQYAKEELSKQQQEMALQDQLTSARSGMTKTQLDAMKNQLSSLGYMMGQQTKKETRGDALDDKQKNRDATESRFKETKLLALSDRFKELPTLAVKIQRMSKIIPETGPIPGIGVGENAFKDFMLSEAGSAIKQDAMGILAALIKIQSGLVVNEGELSRKLKEYGVATDSKEVTFRRGLKNLKTELLREIKAKEAGFAPDVRKTYVENGGILHEGFNKMLGAGTNRSALTPEEQARKEELKKRLGQ